MTTKRASGHRLGWCGYASILRDLQQRPMVAEEVSVAHGLHINTTREILRALHAMKLVHVVDWRPIVMNRRTPVFGFGAAPDKPHPTGRARQFDRSKNLLPTVISLAHVLRALVRPVTIADLVKVSGCDDTWLANFLKHCEQLQLVHVRGWLIGEKGGWPAALWILGKGHSMPRPAPKPRRLTFKENRARRKQRAAHTVVAQQLGLAARAALFIDAAHRSEAA